MNLFFKGFIFLSMVLATTSCGGLKKEEMKIKVIDSSVTLPNYYKDRDGIEWSRDNIFAPRENESLNDPNYQRRMEVFRKEVDPYEKGYEEGYNDAKREYGN